MKTLFENKTRIGLHKIPTVYTFDALILSNYFLILPQFYILSTIFTILDYTQKSSNPKWVRNKLVWSSYQCILTGRQSIGTKAYLQDTFVEILKGESLTKWIVN